MTWRWWRRRRLADRAGVAEAAAVLAESQQRLEAARAQDGEVRQVSRSLRDLGRRNRFAEMIAESMRPTS